MSRIVVLGAGAFGTALAMAAARAGNSVTLYARRPEQAEEMARTRENPRLPGIRLRNEIAPTSDLPDAADALLLAVPAQQTAGFLSRHAQDLPQAPLVLCAKGIDLETLRLQTEIAGSARPTAALTGPGFASEIGQGLPTALTLAGPEALTEPLQSMLASPTFRLYRTPDAIGAQLGGALKNVVAIAAGITIGAGLGESARAATITRGFAEMRRLAAAMGAREDTLMGLSGFGDLALTAGSDKSRNFAHGRALGGAKSAKAQTVEGVATARAATQLAERHGLEMPLAQAVRDVLEGALGVGDAIGQLLARPAGRE